MFSFTGAYSRWQWTRVDGSYSSVRPSIRQTATRSQRTSIINSDAIGSFPIRKPWASRSTCPANLFRRLAASRKRDTQSSTPKHKPHASISVIPSQKKGQNKTQDVPNPSDNNHRFPRLRQNHPPPQPPPPTTKRLQARPAQERIR